MKQIKLISSLLFLFIFISCTESSNPIANQETDNIEKAGISSVKGGDDVLTLTCVVVEPAGQPVQIASHTITRGDLIAKGGGGEPMTWTVYSTYTGWWGFDARIYKNETPPTDIGNLGNPIYNGGFDVGDNMSTSFSAGEGDVIYLWIWPAILNPPLDKSTTLQKLDTFIYGTGTLHLE
jgi:hypothetical protein